MLSNTRVWLTPTPVCPPPLGVPNLAPSPAAGLSLSPGWTHTWGHF